MQIVIDIDDKLYERITAEKEYYLEDGENLCSAIENGVPLPKSHGRLVDADVILNHAHVEEDEDIFAKKWYCIEKDVFDNALVLIDGERRKNERNT